MKFFTYLVWVIHTPPFSLFLMPMLSLPAQTLPAPPLPSANPITRALTPSLPAAVATSFPLLSWVP